MPLYHVKNSNLTKLHINDSNEFYLITNKHVENVLYNRGLIGKEFVTECYHSSSKFMLHFKQELNDNDVSELMILSKGYYYKFYDAYANILKKNLQINFIATKRVSIDGDNTKIIIPYSDISALTDTLLIGDTIATGKTICTVLKHYLEHHSIKKVFVYTIAGSILGGNEIYHFCKRNSIDLVLVYSIAAFGLGTNGFDLSFLHEDTIAEKKYIDKAKTLYNNQPISSVGVDFGSQSQSIKKYSNLCWLEKEFWNSDDSVFPITNSNIDYNLVEKELSAFR